MLKTTTNSSRSSIAALYQEINNSLTDLANDQSNNRHKRHRTKLSSKTYQIQRDSTSHWLVPSYNKVLNSLRTNAPSPPSYQHGSSVRNAAASSHHRRRRHGRKHPRGSNSSTPSTSSSTSSLAASVVGQSKSRSNTDKINSNSKNKTARRPPSHSQHHVSVDIGHQHDIDNAASLAKNNANRLRKRQPVELEPHEKFQERETVLCEFVQASKMTFAKILSMYATFKQLRLPDSDDDEDDDATNGDNSTNSRRDQSDYVMRVLAHVFLREMGRILPVEVLKQGLDERMFINFDIEFVGYLDIREFMVELACCNELHLSIPEMAHVLFVVYGNNIGTGDGGFGNLDDHDDDDDGYNDINNNNKEISAGLLAGLMHKGMESTRELVQIVEKFLSALDDDGDGIITWHEFLGAVYSDSSILASFRNAYSVSRRSRMLGVMMFSPLNRFLRRVNLDWLSLTKIWNEMSTTSAQFKVISTGSVGGSQLENGNEDRNGNGNGNGRNSNINDTNINANENKADDDMHASNTSASVVLLSYLQFKTILKPYFGKAKQGDAPLMSDLFDVAVASDASYVDKQGNNMVVADCHRFVIDLSAALEDGAPSMGSATIQRARFYFMILDLDRSGTIEYDEVYEVISRGQSEDLAKHILQGRRLMRQLNRTDTGTVTKEVFVNASRKHPDLLWRVIHRYPFE